VFHDWLRVNFDDRRGALFSNAGLDALGGPPIACMKTPRADTQRLAVLGFVLLVSLSAGARNAPRIVERASAFYSS
jgi:hypothetical protein